MGGQLDYFGLWISGNYGHGHSKAHPLCSTYNSPRLSEEEEFAIDLVEVWGVGPPLLPDNEVGQHLNVLTCCHGYTYTGYGAQYTGQG